MPIQARKRKQVPLSPWSTEYSPLSRPKTPQSSGTVWHHHSAVEFATLTGDAGQRHTGRTASLTDIGRGPHGIGVGCIYAEVRFSANSVIAGTSSRPTSTTSSHIPVSSSAPSSVATLTVQRSTHCYGVGGKSPPFEGSAKNKQFHQTSPYYSLQGLDFSVW